MVVQGISAFTMDYGKLSQMVRICDPLKEGKESSGVQGQSWLHDKFKISNLRPSSELPPKVGWGRIRRVTDGEGTVKVFYHDRE